MMKPKFKIGDRIKSRHETHSIYNGGIITDIISNNYRIRLGHKLHYSELLSCNYIDHNYNIDKVYNLPIYQTLLEIEVK